MWFIGWKMADGRQLNCALHIGDINLEPSS